MEKGGEKGGVNFGVFPEPASALDGEVGETGYDDGADKIEQEVEDEKEGLGSEGVLLREKVASDEYEEE